LRDWTIQTCEYWISSTFRPRAMVCTMLTLFSYFHMQKNFRFKVRFARYGSLSVITSWIFITHNRYAVRTTVVKNIAEILTCTQCIIYSYYIYCNSSWKQKKKIIKK
jgi:hypothetical protein